MSTRRVVYISGPITVGDQHFNCLQFVLADWQLREHGFAVINPGLSMFLLRFPYFSGMSHDAWLLGDLPLVEVCDAVLRLPGHSDGADTETAHADLFRIPVFRSVQQLVDHFVVKEEVGEVEA